MELNSDLIQDNFLPLKKTSPLSRESRAFPSQLAMDSDFISKLDSLSMEAVVEYKISRFLDQLGSLGNENIYELMLNQLEKPLLNQILMRTGGNQVHSAKILGINRNTLRKKMKLHSLL